jgi:hypothetical protein
MNADEVAAALDLDLDDVPICLACLSFVSFAIDSGDEREIRRDLFARMIASRRGTKLLRNRGFFRCGLQRRLQLRAPT